MTAIDQSPITRVWGLLTTESPFVQSYPRDKVKGAPNVVYTRTWELPGGEVPVISGDSFRGRLRRALANDLFKRIGLKPHDLPVRVAHLFLVGGSLNEDEAALTPPTLAEARSLFPSFALLGGTALGEFAAGRLRAGIWVAQTQVTPAPALHVAEDFELPTAEACFIHEHFARSGTDMRSIFDVIELTEAFRKPDEVPNGTTKARSKAKTDEPKPTEATTAPADDDSVDTKLGLAMPHSYHAVAPGITFAGWVALGSYLGMTTEDDELQRSCLRHGLDLAYPDGADITLGLRASNGYGLVRIDWEDLDVIAPSADRYLAHCEANAEELREKLTGDFLHPKPDMKRAAQRQQNKARTAARKQERDAAKAAKADEQAEEVEAS